MYENTEPWDKNVPADLIPVIKHLRKSFDTAHWTFGLVTQTLCYAHLHNDLVNEDIKEHIQSLVQLKARIGPDATQRFHKMLTRNTPPATFNSYFHFYLDGLVVQIFLIFKELIEIGRANESLLDVSYVEWAESQAKQLIRSYPHLIDIWVRNVCDKQVYDRNEDPEEQIFWRKWQAPMLLIMKPSRYAQYDAARTWERVDAETSLQWRTVFAEHYVLHLEGKLDRAVGEATLEWAKEPKRFQTNTAVASLQKDAQKNISDGRCTPSNARREARKLDTQALYKSWQKGYRALNLSNPNMSDVWYSQRIARMETAKGAKAETIRKHMKK